MVDLPERSFSFKFLRRRKGLLATSICSCPANTGRQGRIFCISDYRLVYFRLERFRTTKGFLNEKNSLKIAIVAVRCSSSGLSLREIRGLPGAALEISLLM